MGAAIRICESINSVFANDIDDRAAALLDVKGRVDKIHDFLINLPRSFHVAHVLSHCEVILEDILSALVHVENELQRVGSMSRLAYRLNRDLAKVWCRINLDNVDMYISALKLHVSYQMIVGAGTVAKVETTVGQDHGLQSNVKHNLDKSSEPKPSDFGSRHEKP